MKKRLCFLHCAVMVMSMAVVLALTVAKISSNATMYISTIADPVTCDPALASDGESGRVIDRVFSGLTRYNRDGSVHLEIAEAYTLCENGLTDSFKIRGASPFTMARCAMPIL